jgi:hypothetical protein
MRPIINFSVITQVGNDGCFGSEFSLNVKTQRIQHPDFSRNKYHLPKE